MNRVFLVYQMAVAVLSVTMVGSLWIYSQYWDFQQEAQTAREYYLASQRSLIKGEVEKVVDYIGYQKTQTLDRLKTSIRNRVTEAHAIALNIYQQNRGAKTFFGDSEDDQGCAATHPIQQRPGLLLRH
jgi:hypothetical protein